MQLGDISVRFIDLMLKTVESLQTSPGEMLRRFNIPSTLLSTPDARISIGKFMVIGHAFIQETRRPELGLMMGKIFTSPISGCPVMPSWQPLNLKPHSRSAYILKSWPVKTGVAAADSTRKTTRALPNFIQSAPITNTTTLSWIASWAGG